MAKVTLAGEAVVITSKFTLEDLKFVQKYRPDALTLVDEDKNPYFAVGVCGKSYGKINKYGAEFATESKDGKKLATITLMTGQFNCDDIKEAIADEIGSALVNLNRVENGLAAVIEAVKAERASVIESIEVLGAEDHEQPTVEAE